MMFWDCSRVLDVIIRVTHGSYIAHASGKVHYTSCMMAVAKSPNPRLSYFWRYGVEGQLDFAALQSPYLVSLPTKLSTRSQWSRLLADDPRTCSSGQIKHGEDALGDGTWLANVKITIH